MDLSLLPTLVAFADAACNLSATARSTGLSQPTVHAHLKRLGEELGGPVYVREGRRLVWTRTGEDAVARARQIVEMARGFQVDATPRVTLAAGRSAWCHLLPELLRGRPVPKPLVLPGRGCWQAVRRGEALLGLAAGPRPDLSVHLFRVVGSCVVAPPGSNLDDPDDWAEQTYILPSAGRPHRQASAEWLSDRGVRPASIVEVDDWAVTLSLVRLGVGWSIVNDHLPLEGLSVRPIDGVEVAYRFGWRPDRHSAAVAALDAWGC